MRTDKNATNPGILFGLSVGPGDPELMTLKACRIIRENEVVAVPGKTAEESVAFRIAVQAVPELREKMMVPIDFPMTRDHGKLEESHHEGARKIESFLKEGENVVFLTLGDVSVYSTFSYVQRIVEADGFAARMVSGVPSFCAAAAALGEPLAEGDEQIHIIPAAYEDKGKCSYVLMKSGRKMEEIKLQISENGMLAGMVENCGMPDEKVYRGASQFPDKAGYFSVIIEKER